MRSSAKGGTLCRECNKPGFRDSTGKMKHERRGNPQDYGGRRADPNAKGNKSGAKTDEEPDRDHVLNRRVFGAKKE